MLPAMIARLKSRRGRRARLVLLAAVALTVTAGVAPAAPAWIARILGYHDGPAESAAARRKPAHYQIDEGGGFVLDHANDRVLLKFDDNPEVWVLTGARGPRGDLIYIDDTGRTLLRTNQMGGVTVFTTRRPSGAAAAADADAPASLRITPVGASALYQRLVQASLRAGHAARHLIAFEAPDADPASDGLIADATVVAGEAISSLAGRPEGRRILTRIGKVEVDRGLKSGVVQRGGVLTITVAPALGFAGRPSSARIGRTLGVK